MMMQQWPGSELAVVEYDDSGLNIFSSVISMISDTDVWPSATAVSSSIFYF